MKVILISVDNHTLGIQTVATVVADAGGEPALLYLPFHGHGYAPAVERKIMAAIEGIVKEESRFLIGFHLKELSFPKAMQLAYAAREYFGSRTVLLVGGTYATARQKELSAFFDHIIVGSAEGIIPILEATGDLSLQVIQTPPKRFLYPSFPEAYVLNAGGDIVRGRTRPLLHPQYRHVQALELMLETGCSYACTFCEVAALREMFGKEYRILPSDPVRSIEIIRREIRHSPNIDYIYFFDEDFLLKSQKWVDTFADLYADIRLPFFIFATPKSVLQGKDKLETLVHVGLDTVNVGVQTGSPRIARELFGRKENREDVMEVLSVLTKLHREGRMASPPMVDFVILNPYETTEDIAQTISLMRDMPLPFNAVMHCMSFFRGTPLYAKAVAEGIIPQDYRFRYDLHDFVSRIERNEFNRDFTKDEERMWLRHNALLGGMNGVHRIEGGERIYGELTEDDMHRYISTDMSAAEIILLAKCLPNPMKS